MKRLVAMMMCAVSLGAAAQSTITYPYNPDGNADALIGVTDLQDVLATYGQSFLPSEILIADSSLSFWVGQVSEVLASQQAIIDSLTTIPEEMVQCQSNNFQLIARDTIFWGDFECDFDCIGFGEGEISRLAHAYELDGNCNTIIGWSSLPEEVINPTVWQKVFVILPDSMPFEEMHLFGTSLPSSRYETELSFSSGWPNSNCCEIPVLESILTSFDSGRPILDFLQCDVCSPVFDDSESLRRSVIRKFQGYWFAE